MNEVDDDSRRIFTSSARYSCGTAAEAFRAALSAADEDEQPQDPDLGVVQKQRFRRWCHSEKIDYGDTKFEWTRVGQEHFVVENDNHYIKITLPSQAGYHVVIDPDAGIDFTTSLPLDYLERQANQIELFGVPSDFLGIIGESHRYQMVTRQVRVLGEPAPLEAIDEMMFDLGFEILPQRYAQGDPSSHSFFNTKFAVFDLRPANVVQTRLGLCIPIDCFVTRLEKGSHDFLLTL